ncbi:DNA-directed RNA polymerase III subunit RPC6 isoform X3 [Erinaceus europaeus]|uniref:DNA-directed RNA polymerase III subunit RPC6 n=1 Tax=Erinaceus europaeus TaxID=9365 RepID=A0ABM3X0H0_ERIEU|nr:DNA-directed RNA polymerase III subunit RPC6 isoform X3 [Erinaceus europaeus]
MAEVKVKVQPPDADPVEIESRIIELCHQFPHGITDQVIQNEMPHIEAQQRAVAINRLLSMGQLDLLRSNTGLLYRIKDSQNAGKMKGSDNQEKLVYQIIEDAGNKGGDWRLKLWYLHIVTYALNQVCHHPTPRHTFFIGCFLCSRRIWSRDIRYKSNLPLTEINKILKNLESKKLIKAVKSVAADTARESKQNPMIQRNSSFASSHEVWKYICELGISKVELSMEDIETILNTLIYDGKVEMTIIAAKEGTVGSVDGHMKLYKAVNPIISPTGLVRAPCGLCPVFDDCHEGGEISPSNCVYMMEWLEF